MTEQPLMTIHCWLQNGRTKNQSIYRIEGWFPQRGAGFPIWAARGGCLSPDARELTKIILAGPSAQLIAPSGHSVCTDFTLVNRGLRG
jgi:hypothetical protein